MHRHSRLHRAGGRLLLLLGLTLLSSVAVAAGPAAAAPTPTVLRATAQSTSVAWGATAILNGVLQTDTRPPLSVDGEQVLVEYSETSNGPWLAAGTVTSTAEPYTSGAYTYDWPAERNYYWHMVFEGTSAYLGRTSNVILVKVRPVLGKPACPASIRAGKQITVSGALKPKASAGSRTVKVKAQRYASGKWRTYKSYTATNADSGSYSKYSVRIKITREGKLRFYATTSDTTALAAGKSAYSRTLRVR